MFIYPKIFDDCVVLLKTCYIVIVCHDLPSLQKCIMTVLIIRNLAWNEKILNELFDIVRFEFIHIDKSSSMILCILKEVAYIIETQKMVV